MKDVGEEEKKVKLFFIIKLKSNCIKIEIKLRQIEWKIVYT